MLFYDQLYKSPAFFLDYKIGHPEKNEKSIGQGTRVETRD